MEQVEAKLDQVTNSLMIMHNLMLKKGMMTGDDVEVNKRNKVNKSDGNQFKAKRRSGEKISEFSNSDTTIYQNILRTKEND